MFKLSFPQTKFWLVSHKSNIFSPKGIQTLKPLGPCCRNVTEARTNRRSEETNSFSTSVARQRGYSNGKTELARANLYRLLFSVSDREQFQKVVCTRPYVEMT